MVFHAEDRCGLVEMFLVDGASCGIFQPVMKIALLFVQLLNSLATPYQRLMHNVIQGIK